MESIRPLPQAPQPLEVILYREDLQSPRFTPRELRMIKAATGGSFAQVLQDEETDDRFVVFAWLKLRREGYDLELAAMDDVEIEVRAATTGLDPSSDGGSENLPGSASTGE